MRSWRGRREREEGGGGEKNKWHELGCAMNTIISGCGV